MKKLNAFLPLAFLLVLLFSCTSDKTVEQGLIEIDLTQDLSVKSDLRLSDIATDINYVKLESKPSCFIQSVDKYLITDDY